MATLWSYQRILIEECRLEYPIAARKWQLKAPGVIMAALRIVEFGATDVEFGRRERRVKCNSDYESD